MGNQMVKSEIREQFHLRFVQIHGKLFDFGQNAKGSGNYLNLDKTQVKFTSIPFD